MSLLHKFIVVGAYLNKLNKNVIEYKANFFIVAVGLICDVTRVQVLGKS